MKYDLLIKNAQIVTADEQYLGNIAIKDGKIAALSALDIVPEADTVIDAEMKHVIPGVIDTHVHIGWPDWDWSESCEASTRAGAAGGVTTALIFTGADSGGGAETAISGTDESSSIEAEVREKREWFQANSYIDGSFHGVIYHYDQIKEILPMATKGGVSSFKFFMVHRAGEVAGPWEGVDDGTLFYGFKEIQKLAEPGMVMTHCENIELFQRRKQELEGEGGAPDWNDFRPNFVEVESVKRAIAFAKETGVRLYLVHLSTKEAREELIRAKAEGVDVIGETCPHYLCLNVENADRTLSKVNPPVRTTADSEALWQGIREGVITCVGSDHADCARKHKPDFQSAIVGMPGIQTLLPAMISEGVNQGRVTLEQVVAVTSRNPARTFGLYPRKGTIAVGSDADLVLVDLNLEKTVCAGEMHYISDFTPYEGKVYRGWPVMTILRGRIIARDNQILGEKGFGEFIERNAELKPKQELGPEPGHELKPARRPGEANG